MARSTLEDSVVENNNGTSGDGGGINFWVGTVSIIDSTVANNRSNCGGGLLIGYGDMNIVNSTVTDNVGNVGGGVDDNGGLLTVTNSTFSGNTGNDGGAVANTYAGTVNISNSTLFGNTSALEGGGAIFSNSGAVAITNSTLSENAAPSGANSALLGGGAVFSSSGTVSVAASILADSTTGGDCSGTITDLGYNLDDDGTCGLSPADNDLSDTDPILDPAGLQNNGGPTQTIALEPGSPAAGAVASESLCSVSDQRGVTRPTPCDIGAYQSVSPTVTNCNDSGPGSLRQAVAGASGGDTVVFNLAPACPQITLTSGPISITTNLTISGPGSTALIVDGDRASNVFVVGTGVNVSISGLSVQDGVAVNGGGISNSGHLAISNVSFVNDLAQPDGSQAYGGGGAIFNMGSLSISNCVFADDTAVSQGFQTFGGAIDNDPGTLAITQSTFTNDQAQEGGALFSTAIP